MVKWITAEVMAVTHLTTAPATMTATAHCFSGQVGVSRIGI
jgi:hypothetical protein